MRSQKKASVFLIPGYWGSFQKGDDISTLKNGEDFMQGGNNSVPQAPERAQEV